MRSLYPPTLGELARITMSQVNYARRGKPLEAIGLSLIWKYVPVSGGLGVRTDERVRSCNSAFMRGN
ncbi:hypothetical protein METHPM2_1010014 [Pseudomonas sp. PM2]